MEKEKQVDESAVVRKQGERVMVSAELALRKARELAQKRKDGSKTTQDDLDRATDRIRSTVKEASDKEEETFHQKLDKLVHKTFGKSKDEKKKVEEDHLKKGDRIKDGDEELTIEKPVGKDKYLVKAKEPVGEMYEMSSDNFDQLMELSKTTLKSYVSKAEKDQSRVQRSGDIDPVTKILHFAKRKENINNARWKMQQKSNEGKNMEEANKSEQLDELSKGTIDSYREKAKKDAKKQRYTMSKSYLDDVDKYDDADRVLSKRLIGLSRAKDRMTKEDIDQIEELSKNTLASYYSKAIGDRHSKDLARDSAKRAGDEAKAKKLGDRIYNRSHGLESAKAKFFAKEQLEYSNEMEQQGAVEGVLESVEQIIELSKSTLGSYAKKASKAAAGLATTAMHLKNTSDAHRDMASEAPSKELRKSAEKKSDQYAKHSFDATEKQIKRQKGVAKAIDRLTKEDVEQIEELYKDPDKHFAKQSKSMQDAINLHMRKGKSYWEAHRAAKKHVKEDVEQQGVAEGSETAADIDKKIEFHKQGQAAAQYKGLMNKMHAAKIRELEAKKQALKQGVAEGSEREMDLDWHYKNIMQTKGLSDKAKKQTTDIYNKLKKKKEQGVAEGSEYKSRDAHKQEQDKAYNAYRTKHATSSLALMTRAEFAKDQRERAAKKEQGVAEGSETAADIEETLAYKQTHSSWAVVPKSKKEFVKFFSLEKEKEAKTHSEKTGGTLKKIDQMGRSIKEDVDQVEESSYQGKGNHRPGWMLRADPELAKKFKEKIDLAKKRQKAYGDPSAGKSVKEEIESIEEMKHGGEYSEEHVLKKIKTGDWEAQTDVKPGKHVELRHYTGKKVTVRVKNK